MLSSIEDRCWDILDAAHLGSFFDKHNIPPIAFPIAIAALLLTAFLLLQPHHASASGQDPRVVYKCPIGDYDNASGVCLYPPKSLAVCKNGTEYNKDTGNCEFHPESKPVCSIGTYDAASGRCLYEPPGGVVCKQGIYDSTLQRCVVEPSGTPSCRIGTFNPTTDRCEIQAPTTITCGSGEYDEESNRCEIAPVVVYVCDVGTLTTQNGQRVCLVSPPVQVTPYCGDEDCNGNENCSTCPSECGVCPEPPQSCSGGDFDGDGALTDEDLANLTQALVALQASGSLPSGITLPCADINGDSFATSDDSVCLSGLLNGAYVSTSACEDCAASQLEVCHEGLDNDCDGQTDADTVFGQDLCSCVSSTPCNMTYDIDGIPGSVGETDVRRCNSISSGAYSWRTQSEWACGQTRNMSTLMCSGHSYTCSRINNTWAWRDAQGNVYPAGAEAPSPSGDYEDSPFGFASGYTYDYLNDLGARWVRGVPADWSFAETRDGFHFAPFDSDFVERYKRGIRSTGSINVLNKIDHCKCYSSDPYCNGNAQKAWFYKYCDENAFKNYVKKVVERYDGDDDYGCVISAPDCYVVGDREYPSREAKEAITNFPVTYWEVMNEPDFGIYWRIPEYDAVVDARGKPNLTQELVDKQFEEYFSILKAANEAIKEVCPDCDVGTAGWSGGLIDPKQQTMMENSLIKALNNGGKNYFDTVTFHTYGGGGAESVDVVNFFNQYAPGKSFVITEMGTYSEWSYNHDYYNSNEEKQARSLITNHIIALKEGIKIILWFVVVGDETTDIPFGSTGVIDGFNGASTKKLSYYSYKLMVEKLEGSDWDNIQEVYNSSNVYSYKFINKQTQKPTYVVWWDYWNEPKLQTKQVTIPVSGLTGNVKITEAVPHFENGLELQNSGEVYPNFFDKGSASVSNNQITITLGKSPVYIEQTTENLGNYIPHIWNDSPNPSNYTCPNKVCESSLGENSKNCPADCGSSTSYTCPNKKCETSLGETELTCPEDCLTKPSQSPVIASVHVDYNMQGPVTIKGTTGDEWFNTWADDNNIYSTFTDGTGFNNDKVTDQGIARIKGTIPNITGENFYLDPSSSFRQGQTEPPGGVFDNKASSLIFIDGVLYGWFHATAHFPQIGYIAYSKNYGRNWTRVGYYNPPGNPYYDPNTEISPNASPFTGDSKFKCSFFINMGKNYELRTDNYVYAFGIGNEWDWFNGTYLMRVPINQITNYSAYSFFSGTADKPNWSSKQSEAVPIPNITIYDQFSVMYHPKLKRYLMLTYNSVYDAPNPWGPWTYAGYWRTKGWYGYQPGIISKDAGDNYFWFTFAGQPPAHDVSYNLNFGKIIMELK